MGDPKDYRSTFDRWSTWELLSIPMLDTGFDRKAKEAISGILGERGVTGSKRIAMSLFACLGCIYNLLRGEWLSLDLQDIIHGWGLNAFVAAFFATAFLSYAHLLTILGATIAAILVAIIPSAAAGYLSYRLVRHVLQLKLGRGA